MFLYVCIWVFYVILVSTFMPCLGALVARRFRNRGKTAWNPENI